MSVGTLDRAFVRAVPFKGGVGEWAGTRVRQLRAAEDDIEELGRAETFEAGEACVDVNPGVSGTSVSARSASSE